MTERDAMANDDSDLTHSSLYKRDDRVVASPGRRSFLGVLLGLGTTGVGILLSVPVVRFLFYPITAKTRDTDWVEVGPQSDFAGSSAAPVQRTVDLVQRDGWRKIVSSQAVYIDNSNGSLRAFSSICPHLGCTVSWNQTQDKFMCPCHGGVFERNGRCVSGPPPRSMDSLETKVVDGKLVVRYQYFRPNISGRQVIS